MQHYHQYRALRSSIQQEREIIRDSYDAKELQLLIKYHHKERKKNLGQSENSEKQQIHSQHLIKSNKKLKGDEEKQKAITESWQSIFEITQGENAEYDANT